MSASYSEVRQFHACQRKWFFKNRYASWNAKDPMRREAFVLSKLQSLSAWRGSLVDSVISEFLIPGLQSRSSRCSLGDTLRAARTRFVEQRGFALAHRVRETGMRVSHNRAAFAAWHDVEYGSPPSDETLDRLWNEIELALRNAYAMEEIFSTLYQCKVVAQPRLFYQSDTFKLAANPDVVAFDLARVVRIIDWKVHFFGLHSAKQQLALYAGVLNRGSPTYSYPFDPRSLPVESYVLTEVQLLQGKVYNYAVTEDDVDEVFDDVFGGVQTMQLAVRDESTNLKAREEFLVTRWPEYCERCSFKKLCIEGPR